MNLNEEISEISFTHSQAENHALTSIHTHTRTHTYNCAYVRTFVFTYSE